MVNDTDKQKIKEFVDHLFNNPNIKDESILIAEGLILNFIVQNASGLNTTFKTPQFFPHLKWNEIIQQIIADLYGRTVATALPVLKNFIDKNDLSILNKLTTQSPLPDTFLKEKSNEFIDEIFKNKDVRYTLSSVVNIFENKIIEKYVGELFAHRGFIFNEIVRVQKNNLSVEEYVVYLKFLLLIKSAAYNKIDVPSINNSQKMTLLEVVSMPKKLDFFIKDFHGYIQQFSPNFSLKDTSIAVKSNLKSDLTQLEEGSARFLYILSTRFHNYKPTVKIDRGAETPDKSWFSIAKKNASYYGFDKRMLDELYQIAGNNNW